MASGVGRGPHRVGWAVTEQERLQEAMLCEVLARENETLARVMGNAWDAETMWSWAVNSGWGVRVEEGCAADPEPRGLDPGECEASIRVREGFYCVANVTVSEEPDPARRRRRALTEAVLAAVRAVAFEQAASQEVDGCPNLK